MDAMNEPTRAGDGDAVTTTADSASVRELLPSVSEQHLQMPNAATNRIVRASALMIAIAGHAALLYAIVQAPVANFGAGGHVLDAISVTLVNSNVLEARDEDREAPASLATAASVESGDGFPMSTSVQGRDGAHNPQTARHELEPPSNLDDTRPEQVQPQEAGRASGAKPDAIMFPEHEPKSQATPSHAANAGGAPARGAEIAASTARGPAAANPGAAKQYALAVVAALGKTKPKRVSGAGTVHINFAIGFDGTLGMSRVSRSSGNPGLDAAALSAVQRASFPPPPSGMTAAELIYEVPYHFR
jgi:protein TonB